MSATTKEGERKKQITELLFYLATPPAGLHVVLCSVGLVSAEEHHLSINSHIHTGKSGAVTAHCSDVCLYSENMRDKVQCTLRSRYMTVPKATLVPPEKLGHYTKSSSPIAR